MSKKLGEVGTEMANICWALDAYFNWLQHLAAIGEIPQYVADAGTATGGKNHKCLTKVCENQGYEVPKPMISLSILAK